MKKAAVHRYFGTLTAIGRAVGISKQGVWMWPEIVPEVHAYKIQLLTHGKLKVNPRLYARLREARVLALRARRAAALSQ